MMHVCIFNTLYLLVPYKGMMHTTYERSEGRGGVRKANTVHSQSRPAHVYAPSQVPNN
jgi:hypothetical protein